MYNLTVIGNAIVDLLFQVEDSFLEEHNIVKASMTLIDENKAKNLLQKISDYKVVAGGSAANTACGLSYLGGTVNFIGTIARDEMGNKFQQDLIKQGVHFAGKIYDDKEATATCFIAISREDQERTMSTYLGVAGHISENDINEHDIKTSKVLYIEGYLWDRDTTKNAIRRAFEIAKKYGVKIAFSLSDSFCVDRHREEFIDMIKKDIDILFANEAEALSLVQSDKINDAISLLSRDKFIANITLGSKGSLVLDSGNHISINPCSVTQIVDMTGAGDLFASGFLYGYTHGKTIEESAKLGNEMASKVISVIGSKLS